MEERLLGKEMEARLLQPEKTKRSISVTPSGITMEVRLLQP